MRGKIFMVIRVIRGYLLRSGKPNNTNIDASRRTAVIARLALLVAMSVVLAHAPASTTGTTEGVTIYRDDFGIPHIFAATEEGACYGMGYAQAEDRLEELLKQYRRAAGTMSEVFGSQYFRDDYRQRLWQ